MRLGQASWDLNLGNWWWRWWWWRLYTLWRKWYYKNCLSNWENVSPKKTDTICFREIAVEIDCLHNRKRHISSKQKRFRWEYSFPESSSRPCVVNLREKFSPGLGFEPGSPAQLVRAPARKADDPALNPGPGENFSLKLTRKDLPDGCSES